MFITVVCFISAHTSCILLISCGSDSYFILFYFVIFLLFTFTVTSSVSFMHAAYNFHAGSLVTAKCNVLRLENSLPLLLVAFCFMFTLTGFF